MFKGGYLSREYLEDLRERQLMEVYDLVQKNGNLELDLFFKDYNEFLDYFNISEGRLHPTDLSLAKVFSFGFHNNLELEKGDCGKCIIYFDTKEGFKLNASKMNKIMPKDVTNEGLRHFFENYLEKFVPYHRDHDKPEGAQILGGGLIS